MIGYAEIRQIGDTQWPVNADLRNISLIGVMAPGDLKLINGGGSPKKI